MREFCARSVVPGAGIEPARSYLRGIFVPLQLSSRIALIVRGLDFLFTFLIEFERRGSRQVSTLSIAKNSHCLARDCHSLTD